HREAGVAAPPGCRRTGFPRPANPVRRPSPVAVPVEMGEMVVEGARAAFPVPGVEVMTVAAQAQEDWGVQARSGSCMPHWTISRKRSRAREAALGRLRME